MSNDQTFPVFDLARFETASDREKERQGEEIDRICRATGFLAVSGHGVSQRAIDACWTSAEKFFALPVEEKDVAKVPYPGYPYGYLGLEMEALARSRGVEAPADRKESFSGGPMGLSLRIARMPKSEIRKRVEEAAQILGLHGLLGRYPKQLSGGQRQRVAMGRAIVRDPKVFLFDEPLSNLDAKLRVQMRSEIKDLHRRLGTTTIYVTHDQIEAMTMADKIVVMRSGAIEQIGAPLEVYDRPQTLFVADFIGSPSMNFIKGTLTQHGFRTPDNLLIPVANKDLPSKDTPASYGIRPEHLILSENGISAKVLVVEPTGSETQVVVKVGDQQLIGAFRQRLTVNYEDTLRIMPDLEKVHLFDLDGRRLN